MTTYASEDRKRLGQLIKQARLAAGYANRGQFAEAMKRSVRQVQALENGEAGVGPETYSAAADVLEWSADRIYQILNGEEGHGEVETGTLVRWPDGVTDLALVSEMGRRLERARQALGQAVFGAETTDLNDIQRAKAARAQREVLSGVDPASVEEIEELRRSARSTTFEPGTSATRNAQDAAAEPPDDDPDDMEPR